MTSDIAHEFSHEVDLTKLSKTGKNFRLEADEDARAKIAARLRVPAVKALTGDIHISATPKTILARGVVRAQLVRECVASLEELDETVDDAFEVEFLRSADDAAPDSSDDEDWLAPEVHEEPVFDIGELLVQQLSLAMDPFPRKQGAVSLAETYGRASESSPFAVLQGKIEKTEENQ